MEGAPEAKISSSESFAPHLFPLEKVSMPEEFLDAVDFRTLNEIFGSLASRSRSYTEPLRKEKIYIEFSESPEGTEESIVKGRTVPGSNEIQIFWKPIAASAEPRGLNAFHTLVHEAVHSQAGINVKEMEGKVALQMGFREVELIQANEESPHVSSVIGVSLDEAMTEEIALEIMQEYFRRTGNLQVVRSAIDQNPLNGMTDTYLADRLILGRVIDAFAAEIGMDRKIVWQGFVQAYMSGEIAPRELLDLVAAELQNSPLKQLVRLWKHGVSAPSDTKTFETLAALSTAAAKRALYAFTPEHFSDLLDLQRS